ncbi:HU family DNA-binding protein [Bacteroides bouchesdurhonensis]|uniref:HU family DNA-binding protein n=1 Tax=Bacteroides bouchesdurhonensis TaxID=1841855 RepID=UPI0011DE5916|nr:HU family DNA-binding protein [Bacteroides bouchesdurhonensis]
MSVIYKIVTRPSDPRVPNSPKRFYPHLVTLGQTVNLKFLAQKMQDRSSLSVGDIKSVIQNFVDKLKEQLLEGKSVNIEGLGVFMLTARSKGADLAKDITANSVESVRIFFQANKELRITKAASRADEKLDLISLDDYLKKINAIVTPENPDGGEGGDDKGDGDNSGESPDPTL